MYPSDFYAVEPGLTPVEARLFLGLEPLLVLLLLLLLLAVAAGMFTMGRRHAEQGCGGKNAPDRVVEDIYLVILRYSSAARSASSNELKQKAEDLVAKINEYLGAVILIGKDFGGPMKALKTALDGEIEVPAKVEPVPEPKTGSCGCGAHHGTRACTCKPAVQPVHPAAGPTVTVTQVQIGTPGSVPATAPAAPTCQEPHRPCPPAEADKPKAVTPAPTKRLMTPPEQTEALDKAVRGFHDYWLDRDRRVADLKNAQAALNRRPPAKDLGPKAGERRVWDPR